MYSNDNQNFNYQNNNLNNYNNKNSTGSPISGIISLVLIGVIIFVGLISFNVIDNPFTFMKKDDAIFQIIPKDISLQKGSTYQLTSEGARGIVAYKSSDENIVDVNEITGFVIAKKAGTATITVYLKDDSSVKDECIVTVDTEESQYEVEEIKLNDETMNLTVGGSKVLTYQVLPTNANIKKIYWKTSNKNIVTIDKNGVIKGVSVGSATVTIRTENGKQSTCKVTVSKGSSSSSNSNDTSSTPIVYTLIYNANGGSVSPTSKIINNGDEYGNLPTPTRNGYTFLGWYTSANGGSKVSSNTKISGNITIHAHWQQNGTSETAPAVTVYTLMYNANGGSVSPTSKIINKGDEYGNLPTPTRNGYTFLGWYTSANGGSKVSSSTKISGNTTIHAHWEQSGTTETAPSPAVIVYTLTYNANGGSVSPTTKRLNNGSIYGTLPAPTRNGYTFLGWYTEKSGGSKVSANTKISGNTTIYAHWQQNNNGNTNNNNTNLPIASDGTINNDYFGIKIGDSVTETVANNNREGINKAIEYASKNSITNIKLKNGTYMINVDNDSRHNGIKIIYSNINFNLNNSTIKMYPNNYYRYRMVLISNVKNVSIYNGNLMGDRENHKCLKSNTLLITNERCTSDSTNTGSLQTHALGYGILIEDAVNVTIGSKENSKSGLQIKQMVGDCININDSRSSSGDPSTSKIYIYNNIMSYCRRQGISIISGNKIEIVKNTIKNIKGTNPQSGIDLEPDAVESHYDRISNVLIENNTFESSIYHDAIHAGACNDKHKDEIKNIDVLNNTIKGKHNIYICKVNGLNVNNNTFVNSTCNSNSCSTTCGCFSYTYHKYPD